MSSADSRAPRVAVVVLTWNGREDTLACLESLAAGADDSTVTIVADNGSTDGTVEAVTRRFPRAEVVRNETNLGFADGTNTGLRRALELGAEYVLVLNNDTLLAEDMIAVLLEAIEQRPDAAATCPAIYFAEPPDLVWYGGASFDPARGRSGRMSGYRRPAAELPDRVREVDWATGAGLMMSARALREVGLFAGELFYHFDDVEWSLRARKAGYRIYLVPRARLWHKVSIATGGEHSPLILYYGTRNHLEVCRRHAPMRGVRALRRDAVILAVHLVQALRSRQRWASVRSALEGARDYRRGRLGRRPERRADSPVRA